MKRKISFGGHGLISVLLVLCSVVSPCTAQNTSACLDHFDAVPDILQGYDTALSARFNDYSETTSTTTQLITITWDESEATANPPSDGAFGQYFEVDSSVPQQWIISLKNSLESLPDYPVVNDSLETSTIFNGFSDFPTCTFYISVNLKDENTQIPQFSKSSYNVDIREDYPVDVIISDLVVEILDNDKASPNNDVTVSVDAGCPLQPMDGSLSDFQGQFKPVDFKLAEKLDFETLEQYTCTITVTDMGVPPKTSTAELIITVTDMPDEPPVFEHEFYYTTLDSAVPNAKQTDLTLEPANIKAVDGDHSVTEVTYGLGNIRPEVQGTNYFSIDPSTGIVSLVNEIDEEMLKNERLLFFVSATDSSGDSSRVVLEITLPPVPTPTPPTTEPITNPPGMSLAFTKDSYVGEIYASFTSVFTLTVEVDGVAAEDVQFALDDNTYFDISSPSGEITVKSSPLEGIYNLTATASIIGEDSLTTSTKVYILVLTQSPTDLLTSNSLYRATVDEEVTAEIDLVSISTIGEPGKICITNVLPRNYKDHFMAVNDGTWKLKKKADFAIDYEMDSEITFKLQLYAEDTAICSEDSPQEILRSEAFVIINVNDVNDNTPEFKYPNKATEYIAYPNDAALRSVVGPIITLQATDVDANTTIIYSFDETTGNSGFSIDETSGEIFTENQFNCDGKGCQLTVVASDGELLSEKRTIMVKSLDMDHIFTLTMSNIDVSAVDSQLDSISKQIGTTLNKVYVNPVIKASALKTPKKHDYEGLRAQYLKSSPRANNWQLEVNVYATDEAGNLMDLGSLNSGLTSAGLDEATAFADRDTFTPTSPGETDTTGLKVAVGILAGLLGIILIVAGFLIFKQRKSAAKKDRKISTVGGAYPNLGYKDDKTDGTSTIGKMSNGVNGSLSRTSFSHFENEGNDSPPLYRSTFANNKDSTNDGNGSQRGLRRTDPGPSEVFGTSSRSPPPAFKDPEVDKQPTLYPSLATTSAVEDKPYLSSYSKKNKKTPPPLSATPARSILRGGGGGSDNHETLPLTDVSLQKSASSKPADPETDYDKDNDNPTSKFSALKGSPVLRKAPSVVDSDHDETDNRSIKSYTSLDAKKSNLKHDKTDVDSEEEKKSVAFKVLVDTKTIVAENMGPAQKAEAQAQAQSDALDILEANKKKLENDVSDDDDEGDVRM